MPPKLPLAISPYVAAAEAATHAASEGSCRNCGAAQKEGGDRGQHLT
jgi:hypothetical protein